MMGHGHRRCVLASVAAGGHLLVVLAAVVAALAPVDIIAAGTGSVETVTVSTLDGTGGGLLHVGDTGLRVAEVQQLLASFGYTVRVDGVYGPQTARAVAHWQHANHLRGGGRVVDTDTLSSLRTTAEVRKTPVPGRATTRPPTGTGVVTIIRNIWPPDLADRAVAIAMRESRLQPGARNACCYGLFQIHYGAHHAWLATIGVTSPSQLLDPVVNATAAYALYQRDGWHPWQT